MEGGDRAADVKVAEGGGLAIRGPQTAAAAVGGGGRQCPQVILSDAFI